MLKMLSNEYKKYANKGLERNKHPLPNIIYKFEVLTADKIKENKIQELEDFKFKDIGYVVMEWTNTPMNKRTKEYTWFWHGFITQKEIKDLLGAKQYSKFCQGKRLFIIQRRVNKKNIPKK